MAGVAGAAGVEGAAEVEGAVAAALGIHTAADGTSDPPCPTAVPPWGCSYYCTYCE